jgi:hypothetical protein
MFRRLLEAVLLEIVVGLACALVDLIRKRLGLKPHNEQ